MKGDTKLLPIALVTTPVCIHVNSPPEIHPIVDHPVVFGHQWALLALFKRTEPG
jgi:hypothetical protein